MIRVGVVGVAIVAAVDERAPDPLAQRPVVGEGQDRIDRRAGVDDRIAGRREGCARAAAAAAAALTSAGTPASCASVATIWVLLVGEQLLAELGEQPRQLLVVGGELLLLLGRSRLAPLADELVVEPGDHAAAAGRRGPTLSRAS